MQHQTIAIAAGAAFVVWRVVVRVRRLVGRQRSRLWRHRANLLFLPLLIVWLALGSLGEGESLLGIGGGAVCGASLAVLGLRRTCFEVTPQGECFFTPFAPIGIGLAALLVSRLAYRALLIVEQHGTALDGMRSASLTPVTLLIFATLASYYSAYAAGLLRWRRRVARGG